jgi:excisionase family DNA binding protein
MVPPRPQTFETPSPSEGDANLAIEAVSILSRHLDGDGGLKITVGEAGKAQTAKLPAAAVGALLELLRYLGQRQQLALIPSNAELPTGLAARYLNVSRPFLVQLLERGEIPFRRVGKHRRVLLRDAFEYRRRTEGRWDW